MEPGKTVQLLGYQASRNVVFTFAVLFIVTAVVWQVTRVRLRALLAPGLWSFLNSCAHLFSNNLFALCVTIVTLGVLERLLPLAIWWLINKLIVWRNRVFGRAMIQGLDAMRRESHQSEGSSCRDESTLPPP